MYLGRSSLQPVASPGGRIAWPSFELRYLDRPLQCSKSMPLHPAPWLLPTGRPVVSERRMLSYVSYQHAIMTLKGCERYTVFTPYADGGSSHARIEVIARRASRPSHQSNLFQKGSQISIQFRHSQEILD